MNNGGFKGTKNLNKYRFGDVIFRLTRLGSPGPGWIRSDIIYNGTDSKINSFKNNKDFASINTWTTQTSNFGTSTINSVSFGNNLWVVGGFTGQIRTSTDAVTWTTQTSNFGTTAIVSVAYGNNIWVAVGIAGQIRTSTDAVTWTTQTSNFGTTQINSVSYGNNLWVAGSNGGLIRTSIPINHPPIVMSLSGYTPWIKT